MSDNSSKIISDLWFEIHGYDKIKTVSKALDDDFKKIHDYAELAEKSVDKVIKKYTTLGKMAPTMSNISSAIYSKQESRRITNIARNTHATERTYATADDIFNYSAARETWKIVEAEKKHQKALEEEMTRQTAEALRQIQARNAYSKELNKIFEKKLEDAKKETTEEGKVRKMTEFQQNKIRVADRRNELSAERNRIRANENADRKAYRNESKNYRAYRERHPEMFATGGQNWNWRYQTARGLSAVGNTVSQFGIGGKVLGGALEALGTFFKSPIAGVATSITKLTQGVIDLGISAVQAYSEIEAIKTQLGVVFSNQTQADSMFGQISRYAVKSPFGVQQTSELAVLLKQSGVYASDLMDTLRMLGDTAGGNMEKMKRIANNYAQIVSIGKASMLDMRQFAYAGIPIFEAVSKELKVSQSELRKMISDGKVTSDIIAKVFKDLTGINGIFENATEKGAKTLKARLQNLADAKQLAFSVIGETITSFGTNTGSDSYVNNIVTTTEDILQWLRDKVDTTNIEKDVNIIANRENRITELSDLMSQFKDNKIMSTLINQAYNAQVGLRDVDAERNIYNKSYEAKMNGHNEAVERYGLTSQADAKELYDAVKFLTSNLNRFNYKLTDTNAYQGTSYLFGIDLNERVRAAQESAAKFGIDLDFITSTTKKESEAMLESLEAVVNALSDASQLTAEEIKAHRETMIINAQQMAYDKAASAVDNKFSYQSKFDELYSMYTNSDEYKEKQQKELIEQLKEAKEVLRDLLSYADKEGNIDITKMSYDKFVSFLDEENRILEEGVKLSVVEGKSDIKMTEDRKILSEQWSKISSDVLDELRKKGNEQAAQEIESMMRAYSLDGDNRSFFTNFNKILEAQLGLIEELAASSTGKTQQDYQNMYKAIMASTFKYTQGAEGLNANLEEEVKAGATNEFIPLWKRILAQYTGLTAQGMTSTAQTLGNYQNDMAIRNMASSVLKATFSSVGLGSAMSFMRVGGLKQLQGDTGGTYQIDWQETKKAIHNFAMQLSASTDVIAAYRKGLEDELATYQELVAAGYTQAESQDLKSQKTVSTKKMSQLVMDAGEQLVNAFGERFETASGKSAYLKEDGLFYDEKGVQIQEEELRLTGNLFKMIETRLGQLYSEIHEANAQQLNNEAMGKMLKEVAPSEYISRILGSGGSREQLSFLLGNPEYIESFLNTAIDKLKQEDAYKQSLGGVSNTDIILRALNDEEKRQRIIDELNTLYNKRQIAKDNGLDVTLMDQAIDPLEKEYEKLSDSAKLLNEAFKELGINVSALTDNDDFATLNNNIKNLAKTNALNTAVAGLLGVYTNGNEPKYLQNIPSNYGGWRGSRNWLYGALGWNSDLFDKEDLYLEAAKRGYFVDQNGNDKYADKQALNGLDAKTFADALETADKNAIDLQYHFEEMRSTIESMATTLVTSIDKFAQGAWLAPFESFGQFVGEGNGGLQKWWEALKGTDDTAKDLRSNMEALAADMLKNIGASMADAGFKIAGMGAMQGNWGLVAGGLALAAAGGFASGLGSALAEGEKTKDKSNKEAERLEALTNDLKKLLEQARTDALYYENNLRHQTALGINREFSYKSVHDAVITPQGNVVTTDPRDYLIATKTPQNFVSGGNVTVSPVINCNVVNNSSAQVRQEQTQNADGSIDIITIIEEVAGGYIASSRSDDAFNARSYRMNGRQSVM